MGSADRFSFEWVNYPKIIPAYEQQFLKWITPLRKLNIKNKKVLDAGCGTGRNSYWPLYYGAKSVVAFDVDKHTVEVARENLANFKNARVDWVSIYDIDYKEEFDLTICIGVLHHLENPKKAIENLIKATKKGGKLICWVYGYEGNKLKIKFINPIRAFTSHIPPSITNLIAYFFSVPFYLYLKLFPQKNEYLAQLKQFWFWHIHTIVLDQLLPKIANYWKKEEVKKLFTSDKLEILKISPVNSISWAILSKKR